MKHTLISAKFLSGKIAKAQDIITGQNYWQSNPPSFKCRSSQQVKDSWLFSKTTQAPHPLCDKRKSHTPRLRLLCSQLLNSFWVFIFLVFNRNYLIWNKTLTHIFKLSEYQPIFFFCGNHIEVKRTQGDITTEPAQTTHFNLLCL